MKKAFGALAIAFVLCLSSCGVWAGIFGKPAEFSFSDGKAQPVSKALVPSARAEGIVDHVYSTFEHDKFAMADLQSKYKSKCILPGDGYVASYTPATFTIPVSAIYALRYGTAEGFDIFKGENVLSLSVQTFDFLNPVYLNTKVLMTPGTYEMIYVTPELYVTDLGGKPYAPDIKVKVAGFTQTEMPDKLVQKTYDGNTQYFPGRRYDGDNIFTVSFNELFPSEVVGVSINATFPFVYRKDLSTANFYSVKFSGGSYEAIQAAKPSYASFYGDSTYPFRWQPECWVDIPFPGIEVSSETKGLSVQINWNLDGIIQLWKMNGEYRLLIAPDFLDRFSFKIDTL